MYEEFFGLDRRPFSFQPDATCIHWTPGHQSAFATLQAGIERQCPITLVTGEVGCGKTTLIRHFLETAPVDLTIGLLSNFVSGRGSVLEWALMAFDQSFEGDSEPELLQRFQEFTIAEYAAGRRTALIVDEAQNISAEDLESLRLLSNVNADDDVLLLMFLVGQPELRQRLADPKFRQIVQRIGSDFHLNALTEEETADYIRFLLAQAGAKEEVFDDESLKVIFGVTAGIPRKINLLADLCMVFAFAEDRRAIDAGFIRKILGDLGERGIFASLTAPSAEMPEVELDESQHSTPIEHVAWAPKVVGLNRPLAPGAETLLPASVTTGRGPANPATEPEIRPGKDDKGEEDAVGPPQNTGPQQPPEPETEVTNPGLSAAVSDAVPGETAVPEPTLESDLPKLKTAGSGWHRYLLGAAALLAIAIGGAYVGLKPEQTQTPEAPDQTSPQFAHGSAPATLQEVRTSGDRDGPSMPSEVLRSEVPNLPAGNGAPQQLQAQVGESRAAPPETIPAEVARPVPAYRILAAASGNLSNNADPGGVTAGRALAPLVQVAPESVLPEPGLAIQASGAPFDVRPSPFAPVIWVHAASSAVEPVIPASFKSLSGTVSEAMAVVRDPGQHQAALAGREPAGLFETPSAAGRVAWREASFLAAEGAGAADRSTLADFGLPTSLASRAKIAPLQLAALEAPGNRLGRAKQSVRLIPDGDALMLLSALDPQDRLDPGQVPAGEKSHIVSSGDAADLSGREYFKQALTLSLDDPSGAAVLYTRAALRGHKRSAYYLGQIYETGDGVPVDFSLARAWYSAMGPGDAKTQRRIRALPEPSNQRAALSVPRPLWAETTQGGSSEFVWTSGKGGDAAFFFVQVTGRDSRVPEATFKAELSGAFLELPPSVAFWRVLAVDPASAQYAASAWIELSQPGDAPAPAGATSSGAEVVPSAVIAHAPGSASARVAEMSDALASMEIPARTVASQEVAGTGDRIYFFYDQDRAAAEALAELISADAANSVSKAAPSHDGILALPGEILVTLGDPRS